MGFLSKIAISALSVIFGHLCFCQENSSKDSLVEIGHKHHLFVSPTGSDRSKLTVVFESGGGGGANDWKKVKSLLPTNIRTIAYDRAGTGKSKQGVMPRTMAQEVYELNRLLKALRIKGPIIIVGQSIGGLLARLYTENYGQNVVGLVLVDPTHENAVLGSMRYGGWTRLREKAVGKVIPVPQLKLDKSIEFDSTADYMAEEFQKIYLSTNNNRQSLKNRPLIILGAGIRKQPPGTPDEQWKILKAEKEVQVKELADLSGNSMFILDPKSSHFIHFDNPEIVARAIEKVINAVKTKGKLQEK